MDYTIETLISQEEVQKKVVELAERIKETYKGCSELLLVGLLRGSVIFLSDLAREINIDDVKLDFMTVSSYGNSMESSKDVKIKKRFGRKHRGKRCPYC